MCRCHCSLCNVLYPPVEIAKNFDIYDVAELIQNLTEVYTSEQCGEERSFLSKFVYLENEQMAANPFDAIARDVHELTLMNEIPFGRCLDLTEALDDSGAGRIFEDGIAWAIIDHHSSLYVIGFDDTFPIIEEIRLVPMSKVDALMELDEPPYTEYTFQDLNDLWNHALNHVLRTGFLTGK